MIFNIFTEDTLDVVPPDISPSSHKHERENRILAGLMIMGGIVLVDFSHPWQVRVYSLGDHPEILKSKSLDQW